MIREVYKASQYRVVFSTEEHRAALAEGWSDDKPIPASDLHLGVYEHGFAGIPENEQPSNLPKRRGRPPMNRTPEAA